MGFSATVAHHLDLGGGAPGLNMAAGDVHQEGLIFPPSRYNVNRDWNGGPFERLVRANVRVPEKTIGDCNAQFAANGVGARRVIELCEKFGADAVTEAMAGLLDYAEQRMRAAIAAAPDGVYAGRDQLDSDGENDEPLVVTARVEIAGDTVSVDYEGTCDQVRTNVNCPFASTIAAGLSCIKSVLTSPDIPFNEGAKRPIAIAAPYGSLLNPRPPAPVRARMLSAYRAYNAVMKALAHAVPEQVMAAGFDTTHATCLSHLGEEGYGILPRNLRRRLRRERAGRRLRRGGQPAVELLEHPRRGHRHGARVLPRSRVRPRRSSGGAGENRGGLGVRRVYEVLADDVEYQSYSDRFTIAPEGLFGGDDGGAAFVSVLRGNQEIALGSKTSFRLAKGDRVVMSTGGGAGYGNIARRPPDRVAQDRAGGA